MGFCFSLLWCYNQTMKRTFTLFSLITSILLTGCSGANKKNKFVGGDLIFSEFYVGEIYSNRAVELANVGDKTLDLSAYTVRLYRDGGAEKPKVTDIISLSGSLEPNETYVICYSSASEEIKSKANLVSDDFLNDGTFPMTINNKAGKIVDYLGFPGYFYDIGQKSDAVRKKDKLKASPYSGYDWIRYPVSNLNNLGNLECISNDELLQGPKLTQEDFNTPYTLDGETGEGGCLKVSLNYTIDGDTTKFDFGTSLASYGISGSNSMRYYGINTPEIAHNGNPADPYGPEARDFTNSLINSAKHFVVQSVKGYSLFETYGRMLGYVWISDRNDPRPEDYLLLNHCILQNGYARVGFISRGGYNDYMLYNGISYVEYLFDAQQYAIANKLHIYEDGL